MSAQQKPTGDDFNILAVDFTAPDAAEQFAKSLRETGFAVIKNHGVSEEEIGELYADWKTFFEDDMRTNYRHDLYADTKGVEGLFEMRSENAKDSKFKDLKRFYHFYKERESSLPPLPSGLEERTAAFFDKMAGVGDTMLEWLDEQTPDEVKKSFSMPLREMPHAIKEGEASQSLLRIIQYPELDDSVQQGEVRAAAHEDINLITLLVAGSEPGLEAQDRDGNWHPVPCDSS